MRRWSRRVVILIGVLCIAVGIGLAMSWEEAAIRYQLHRLRTEPGYLQEVVIGCVAQEHAWAPALGSDANYIVEFVEYDTRPRHTLAWAAVGELMKSEQGRKAFVQALESAELEKAVMGMVQEVQERVLEESARSPMN